MLSVKVSSSNKTQNPNDQRKKVLALVHLSLIWHLFAFGSSLRVNFGI
jgi:hypothetical protein